MSRAAGERAFAPIGRKPCAASSDCPTSASAKARNAAAPRGSGAPRTVAIE
jgi:hypothetical protein